MPGNPSFMRTGDQLVCLRETHRVQEGRKPGKISDNRSTTRFSHKKHKNGNAALQQDFVMRHRMRRCHGVCHFYFSLISLRMEYLEFVVRRQVFGWKGSRENLGLEWVSPAGSLERAKTRRVVKRCDVAVPLRTFLMGFVTLDLTDSLLTSRTSKTARSIIQQIIRQIKKNISLTVEMHFYKEQLLCEPWQNKYCFESRVLERL